MYICNPKNGAPIRDVWIYDKLYFSEKAQETFACGDVIDMADKPGAYLLELYGFLKQVSAIQAKNIIADRGKETFLCDYPECGFEAKNKVGLIAHKRTHESKVDGVRVVKPLEEEGEEEEEKVKDSQQDAIDQEAKNSGLIGEGLTFEGK